MPQISINELKEKFPDEPVDLVLENIDARLSLNISSDGRRVSVSALVWGAEGLVASGQLNNAQGNSEWTLDELAEAFGISPDAQAWTMNDRI